MSDFYNKMYLPASLSLGISAYKMMFYGMNWGVSIGREEIAESAVLIKFGLAILFAESREDGFIACAPRGLR